MMDSDGCLSMRSTAWASGTAEHVGSEAPILQSSVPFRPTGAMRTEVCRPVGRGTMEAKRLLMQAGRAPGRRVARVGRRKECLR
ncbi:hypothetical protein Save01_04339 [Streptomyces avermitilis]|uniref:Uncharacterized protein n=1 Tax=Streptomyces avermitilis TaxID=33903 RepID=A0A224AUY1_STRAX|nr:hypothetical protein [Streptomyces avermitilis]GDY68175.1 hypothetical protein SAV14893_075680 [Streptomyces avermitilis]GDY71472.1 hypothetical protein SAV31267_009570 [Streptomyces avermitilis]